MNTQTLLFSCLLAALGAAGAQAVTPADLALARAEVRFVEPEKFSDVRADAIGSERDRTVYLDMLREHLEKRVAEWLPAGHKLTIAVLDVDMAGEFEPWRGPRFQDIRIVKDIYPPRINLEFRLENARGELVREGSRQLRDLTFMMNLSINRNDSLRHEKELIDAWLKDEFPRSRAS
jgi:hypothetical protein